MPKQKQQAVTLDQLYQEFVAFAQAQEKHWKRNSVEHKQIIKRFDYMFDVIDKDVMENRMRIERLEKVKFN